MSLINEVLTIEKKTAIDSITTFFFLKKLMQPVKKSNAFKLRLVDDIGKVIKKPTTDEEKQALTILDKFTFKMRRLLGGKLAQLNNFLFLQSLNNNLYNKVIVNGTIAQRAEIKRIERDLEKLQEKYDCDLEDIILVVMNEQIRNNKNIF